MTQDAFGTPANLALLWTREQAFVLMSQSGILLQQ